MYSKVDKANMLYYLLLMGVSWMVRAPYKLCGFCICWENMLYHSHSHFCGTMNNGLQDKMIKKNYLTLPYSVRVRVFDALNDAHHDHVQYTT